MEPSEIQKQVDNIQKDLLENFDAMECVHELFDYMFQNGAFSEADYFFEKLNTDDFDNKILLTLLVTSHPFKDKLPNRSRIFNVMKERYNSNCCDNTEEILLSLG